MAVSKAQSFLITGANRGLGLEMVKQLVVSRASTCRLFAACRDPDAPKSQALQDLAKKYPKVITVIQLDTTDPRSVKEAAMKVGAKLEGAGLNVLVNNAGVLPRGDLLHTSEEEFQTSMETNLMGPVRVTKEFLPYLIQASKASTQPGMSCSKAAVINISALLASIKLVPETYIAHPAISYRISKTALNMFNQCAAFEFTKDGILFAAIHPGWVRTDMGGPDGEIDVVESVQGVLKVMNSLTEKQNGAFLDYHGKQLPW
ncbi:C-factor-like isoform X7 [Brienomyrus brachyistius]|uniref:C-factor-like isoform X7 n=1 Tax=Brienomyrus brachyistius TaxID=42636 RepID=UPI0020B1BB6F|nr:C-factor-like isoform X7 [Brienomyrus brachyistius]